MLEDGKKTELDEENTSDYIEFYEFAKSRGALTYESFDSHTMKELSLFAVREDIDFSSLEELIDRIIRDLPAIKRIFSSPIIRLKDRSEVLPVESVRMINNRTIVHVSSHSELWENVTDKGLRPRKLMTLQHEDQYEIYENIVFAKMIQAILRFVRTNICSISDLLYSNREMKLDLLERVNHLSHYLAMAKLHTGYIREHEKYRVPAERCLDKLLFIERILKSRLGSPVYKKCKSKSCSLELKRTNIFRMHKDYHRVYLLMKSLIELRLDESALSKSDPCDDVDREAYSVFCAMLLVFASGHFNFDFLKDQTFDLTSLSAHAVFLSWYLKIEKLTKGGDHAFLLTFLKEKRYKILLVCSGDDESVFEKDFDECFFVSENFGDGRSVRVSLYDIDSFRRIQRIILRGMIMSDTVRDICPFCGRELSCVSVNNVTSYECDACRMQIHLMSCPDTGKKYVATSIKHYKGRTLTARERDSDESLLRTRTEGLMHFRNITEIDSACEIICPVCNKKHAKGT